VVFAQLLELGLLGTSEKDLTVTSWWSIAASWVIDLVLKLDLIGTFEVDLTAPSS
jgi:hypothetical protein